jgi:serine/threonine-protein kinase
VARNLLVQVAEALAAVHAVGIVHRDVKASNVLLTEEGVAKLTDFGIARGGDNKGHTRRGSLLGTPAYMAPEGPIDARSDLYSLGVLYYELLSGVLPFTSTHYQEVILAHVESMPDLDRLPASERGLTGWLMAKSPAARPQSAAALVASLGSKDSGAIARPPAPQPQRQPIPQPQPATPPPQPPAPGQVARNRPAIPPTPTPTPGQAPYLPTVVASLPSTPPPNWRPPDGTRGTARHGAAERDQQTMVLAIVVGVVALVVVGGVVLLAAVSGRSAGASGSSSGGSAAGTILALVLVSLLAFGAVAAAVVLVMFRTRSKTARGRGSNRANYRGGPPGPPRR